MSVFKIGQSQAEVEDLREDWMAQADRVLADEALVAAVYEALGQRHPKSKSRGRQGTPAEVVLRLLLLKHIRNWSYEVLEREVRANLVYRDFTRVGAGKTPDAKTMGRWGVALGADVIKQIHVRMVTMAQSHGLAEGRRMRVDTTVVETNIHYPTDSSLLGDGVRVLTRAMKTITKIVGEVGTKLRDRSRSVKRRVLDIARAARSKAKQGQEKLKRAYGQLLNSTSRVVGQAKRFASEITVGLKRSAAVVQRAGGAARQAQCDGAAGQTGDATDPRAHPARRHAQRRQTREPVRAIDGNHPQGQGRQADRVRQDDQAAGGREPDRHRL